LDGRLKVDLHAPPARLEAAEKQTKDAAKHGASSRLRVMGSAGRADERGPTTLVAGR
jgi:hypothetical protein